MTLTMPPAEWERLRGDVNDIAADVEKIKTAIVGNDLGTHGIVKRLDVAERNINALVLKAVAASAFVSGVIAAIKWIIAH